jgi:hypothetical protein
LNESEARDFWPSLPLGAWRETYATLHRWTQVVGKVQLALAPPVNHWWHSTFNLTARGLVTSPLSHGRRVFQIDFDFVDHRLNVVSDDGASRSLPLEPCSVADFHARVMAELRDLGLETRIWTMPVELEAPVPFEDDHAHASYDAEYANRAWRILLQTDRVLRSFRGGFLGKASPVHFFWGAFDLALTYFSGRPAPVHPGGVPHLADHVVREAYSHECASMGFWPGGGAMPEPAFYAYAYPEPEGYREHPLLPEQASYHPDLREYVLPYEAVRTAPDPDATLLAFLRSTYAAAASLGGWDRDALERRGWIPHG